MTLATQLCMVALPKENSQRPASSHVTVQEGIVIPVVYLMFICHLPASPAVKKKKKGRMYL